MKVGKTVSVINLPVVTVIYATNIAPVAVSNFGLSVEEYTQAVKDEIEKYQQKRRDEAVKHGELD